MERGRFQTKIAFLCTSFVIAFLCISCSGAGGGSIQKLDISIPEEMPVCPEGKATPEIKCFEGRWINEKELQETCGRYWDIEDEEVAIMEVNNCRKRNIAVLKYYLFRNREQLLFINELLK